MSAAINCRHHGNKKSQLGSFVVEDGSDRHGSLWRRPLFESRRFTKNPTHPHFLTAHYFNIVSASAIKHLHIGRVQIACEHIIKRSWWSCYVFLSYVEALLIFLLQPCVLVLLLINRRNGTNRITVLLSIKRFSSSFKNKRATTTNKMRHYLLISVYQCSSVSSCVKHSTWWRWRPHKHPFAPCFLMNIVFGFELNCSLLVELRADDLRWLSSSGLCFLICLLMDITFKV